MITLFEQFGKQDEIVPLGRDGDRIEIKKYELSGLNGKIKNYLNQIYGPYGYFYGGNDKDITIENRIFNTEYIDKFVNNRAIFGLVLKNNKIRTKEKFVEFVENNLYDLYHFNGKYFEENMRTVVNTSNMGKRGEEASLDYFTKLLDKKGIKINIKRASQSNDPTEDIGGIDGKFEYNGKTYTIQVKPYDNYIIDDNKIIIKSKGSISFNTNYLVLYKEIVKNLKYDFITLSNGLKCDKIEVNNGYYTTDIKNLRDPDLAVLMR